MRTKEDNYLPLPCADRRQTAPPVRLSQWNAWFGEKKIPLGSRKCTKDSETLSLSLFALPLLSYLLSPSFPLSFPPLSRYIYIYFFFTLSTSVTSLLNSFSLFRFQYFFSFIFCLPVLFVFLSFSSLSLSLSLSLFLSSFSLSLSLLILLFYSLTLIISLFCILYCIEAIPAFSNSFSFTVYILFFYSSHLLSLSWFISPSSSS